MNDDRWSPSSLDQPGMDPMNNNYFNLGLNLNNTT